MVSSRPAFDDGDGPRALRIVIAISLTLAVLSAAQSAATEHLEARAPITGFPSTDQSSPKAPEDAADTTFSRLAKASVGRTQGNQAPPIRRKCLLESVGTRWTGKNRNLQVSWPKLQAANVIQSTWRVHRLNAWASSRAADLSGVREQCVESDEAQTLEHKPVRTSKSVLVVVFEEKYVLLTGLGCVVLLAAWMLCTSLGALDCMTQVILCPANSPFPPSPSQHGLASICPGLTPHYGRSCFVLPLAGLQVLASIRPIRQPHHGQSCCVLPVSHVHMLASIRLSQPGHCRSCFVVPASRGLVLASVRQP